MQRARGELESLKRTVKEKVRVSELLFYCWNSS